MNTQTCLHSCHRHANFCLSMVNGWQESFHHRATPSTDENMKKKSKKMKKNFKKMKKNFKKLKKFYANKLFLPCPETQGVTSPKLTPAVQRHTVEGVRPLSEGSL